MSELSELQEPAFKRVEVALKQFSELVGGTYRVESAMSEQEIRYSIPAATKWLVALVDRISQTLSPQNYRPGLKTILDQRFLNVYVDCGYQNSTIRFHARNVGFGLNAQGKFDLRVTSVVSDIDDFRFNISKKTKAFPRLWRASKIMPFPICARPFISEGMLKSHDCDVGKVALRDVTTTSLLGKYAAKTSNEERGEKILNDARIQQYLLALPDVQSLSIGYTDWRLGTDDKILEINEALNFCSAEALITTLRLMEACLTILKS